MKKLTHSISTKCLRLKKILYVFMVVSFLKTSYGQIIGPGDWSSTRLYGHAYNINGFTNTEYDFIANHNYLFAIEKRHARNIYGNPTSEFASGIAAQQIKVNNPVTKPLFYWNSSIVYDDIYESITAALVDNPSFVASNGKFNYENADFPDWWASVPQNQVNNTAHEGVFIDACQNVEATWGADAMPILYNMLDQIPGLVIANGFWPTNGPNLLAGPDMVSHVDGIFVESFFQHNCATADQGKIMLDALLEVPENKYIITSSTPDGVWSNDHTFSMACFLIIANNYSFFHFFNGPYASSETQLWHDDFGKTIGAPRGKATVNGYVYTRTFANAIVTVDLLNRTSSIVWGPTTPIIHEAGLIQAEEYNDMNGIQTVTTTDTGGGLNVGFINTGDWMEYEVDVPFSGTYDLDYRVASLNGGGSVQFQVDGVTQETTSIAATGGWQNWETLSTTVSLSAGLQTIRLYVESGGWNINWLDLDLEYVPINNLALNGIARQSTTAHSGDASRAIDGNTSGVYGDGSVTHTENITNSWWEVDLGSDYNIGDIKIFNRTDACCTDRLSHFTVIVTDNAGNRNFVKTFTSTPNPSITIDAVGITGKVVKVRSNLVNSPLSLAEVEVYSSEPIIETITLQENETGFCDVDGTVNNNQTGYTGDGFANTSNALGNGIDWKINGSAGDYTFMWKYASTSNVPAKVLVDGSIVVHNIAFGATGSLTTWVNSGSRTVSLPAGVKTVRLEANTASGLGNIDYIKITGPDISASSCLNSTNVLAKTTENLKATDTTSNDLQTNQGYSIYPNPTAGMLTVNVNEAETVNFNITDMTTGRIVLTGSIHNGSNSIDMSNLLTGIYIIRISSENSVYTNKIIKK